MGICGEKKQVFEFFQKDNDFFLSLKLISEGVLQGIKLLKGMIQESNGREEKARMIKEVEEVANQIVYETVTGLHKPFVTPIYRESIYTLVTQLDDILDCVDEISQRTLMHEIYEIKDVSIEAIALIEVLEKSVEELAKGVDALKDLEDPQKIVDTCLEIKRLEFKGDRASGKATANLFTNMRDKAEIIKWSDIYRNLERAIDRCEDVANTLEKIVVEHA
jgi:predicted phosphate transport protein (TIGR00153 family)